MASRLLGTVFSLHGIGSANTFRQLCGVVLETRQIVSVDGRSFVRNLPVCQSWEQDLPDNLLYISTHIGRVGLLLVVNNCRETSKQLHRESVSSARP